MELLYIPWIEKMYRIQHELMDSESKNREPCKAIQAIISSDSDNYGGHRLSEKDH